MKKPVKMDPTQVLVMGFAAVILIGSLLLSLPIATVGDANASYLDCIFTSTSAVCVTGLVVQDTGTYWSPFGQVVILLMIQIGGLGFMTMATMILMLMGRRIRLRDRLVIQEALNEFSLQGLVALIKRIALMTFSFEIIGMMLLSTRFIPQFGPWRGLYMSVFHSISAFCNAGFDLMGGFSGQFSSFTAFANDFVVNFTLMGLIIVGGLGFTVLLDMQRTRRYRDLSLHSKVVLLMSGILLLLGFIFFFAVELTNPKTLADPSLKPMSKGLAALFQSVTARTAGFNTISQDGLTLPGKFMTTILMFIGASPAGTGGGIKTTTFAVVILMVVTVVRGREEVTVFNRRLAKGIAFRALAITFISFVVVIIITMVLSIAEQGNTSELMTFDNILYEAVSAFGTVGLSAGITPTTSTISRLFTITTMFVGRVGPMTLALAFARRLRNNDVKFSYPEGKIMVG